MMGLKLGSQNTLEWVGTHVYMQTHRRTHTCGLPHWAHTATYSQGTWHVRCPDYLVSPIYLSQEGTMGPL